MKKTTRTLCRGGVCVALALALSYLKIPIGLQFGGFGGSVNLVMIPLILFAVSGGTGWGVIAGLVFGTLKYFLGEGTALNWVSLLLDYSIAYAAVGLAGIVKKPVAVGALVGCAARFIVHFISGITVYAQWMPEEFMGLTMTSPWLYSLLYNGTYMLPNTILAVVLCALLAKPLRRFLQD